MEAGDIRAMEVELFDGELLRLAVEYRNAATVSTQRLLRHHPKSGGFPCVNSVGEFCLL